MSELIRRLVIGVAEGLMYVSSYLLLRLLLR